MANIKKTSSDKKIIFYITVGVVLLIVISGATIFQLLPFLIILFLMYQYIWNGVKRRELIIAISVLMTIINLLLIYQNIFILMDVAVWGVIAFTFWKK